MTGAIGRITLAALGTAMVLMGTELIVHAIAGVELEDQDEVAQNPDLAEARQGGNPGHVDEEA